MSPRSFKPGRQIRNVASRSQCWRVPASARGHLPAPRRVEAQLSTAAPRASDLLADHFARPRSRDDARNFTTWEQRRHGLAAASRVRTFDGKTTSHGALLCDEAEIAVATGGQIDHAKEWKETDV